MTGLLTVILMASIYFSLHLKPLLAAKIREVVYSGSGHLYTVSFRDIRLNILTGSVTADHILIAPDTNVYHKLRETGQAPAHLFRISLEKLQLRRIGILTVYFRKKIEMDDIILDRPSITMIYRKVHHALVSVRHRRSLFQRISRQLNAVHIKGIKVENAQFNYVSGASGEILNTVSQLNLQVKDFLLDSSSAKDTTRFYYTKDVSFAIAGYHALSRNKRYTTKIDSITGSARGHNIHIRGFRMIPMYPELQFSRMLPTQQDRYDLNFPEIDFRGVNFFRLNSQGRLHARSLTVSRTVAKVFMNRERPPGKGNKSANFPHRALQRLPVQVTIDTLRLRQVSVAYTEYNPVTEQRGIVHVDELGGQVLHVTNDSVSLAQNHHAIAKLDALLVKAARLHLLIDFNLSSARSAFAFRGHVGPMDMVSLNPVASRLGLVSMDSGKLRQMDFRVQADAAGSRGTMQMQYDGLKVALLKEGGDGQPVRKKALLSFLANALVIRDANPSGSGKLRTAEIRYVRPPGGSFFNLLWKSVLVGMRETVGIGFVRMKSPQEGRRDLVKKMEKRKERRRERAQERRADQQKSRSDPAGKDQEPPL